MKVLVQMRDPDGLERVLAVLVALHGLATRALEEQVVQVRVDRGAMVVGQEVVTVLIEVTDQIAGDFSVTFICRP